MNMKKKQTQILAIIVAAIILVAALVFHLVRINSDPLVSLSYLNNTVQPELEKEFSNQLDVKADELQKSFAAAVNNNNGSYKSVKIEKDQKVTFGSDSEFVFVSGNATASKDRSICDVTDGKTLDKGDTLAANHLFIALADGASIKSTSETVFMVRGVCTVS
jgi:hypothetical protein